jgi:histidine triad (HIT) family protein
MEGCVFCKIVAREIPAEIEKETENVLVFKDIHPSAPVHLLIIPKTHLKDITEVPDQLFLEMKNVALTLAKEKGMRGFRLATNAGETAFVPHLHMHLLSGITKDRTV